LKAKCCECHEEFDINDMYCTMLRVKATEDCSLHKDKNPNYLKCRKCAIETETITKTFILSIPLTVYENYVNAIEERIRALVDDMKEFYSDDRIELL